MEGPRRLATARGLESNDGTYYLPSKKIMRVQQYLRAMTHLLKQISPRRSVRSGVEVGVCRGDMASHLLGNFSKLHLVLVDMWELAPPEKHVKNQDGFDNFKQAMTAVAPFWPRWNCMKAMSLDAAAILKRTDVKFDFVFIDADHNRGAVKADLNAWWPLVKSGGLFCGHDYHGKRGGVTRAVDSFAAGRKLVVTGYKGHVWSIWKP